MPYVIALVLLAAFFVLRAWGRDRAEREVAWRMDGFFRCKNCRWAKVGRGATLQEYQFETCGVSAYFSTGKPPQDFKRQLRGGL